MNGFIKLSDASSLGIHAMIFMANKAGATPTSAHEISQHFEFSEAHLIKVLQRLAKLGLVESIRGPKGGWRIARPLDSISLFDIHIAIEGEPTFTGCILKKQICDHDNCPLKKQLYDANQQVAAFLTDAKLSQFA